MLAPVERTGLQSWIAVIGMAVSIATFCPAQDLDQRWAQWRGPVGTGEAVDANPPTQWSETEGVKWKTPIPGRGHSTPIIWGEQVFVTTAVKTGKPLPPKMSGRPGAHDNVAVDSAFEFVVIAFNRETGKVNWQSTVATDVPHEGGHYTASLASASPCADDNNVYVSFGSHGIYCLSQNDGTILWQKQLGKMHSKHGHGEGSSPALFGDTLIVNWDHEEQSFLVAIDKASGKTKWKRERDEVTSWSSPIVARVAQKNGAAKAQVIVCGTDRVRGYDLESGETVWQCGGMSANIVATPIYHDGVVYVGSSYEKRTLMAINVVGATGDLTESDRILWSLQRGTPYVPSPLLTGGRLYFLTHYQNVLTGVDAETGEPQPGAMRLGDLGNVYASPVAAGGNLYVTDLDGVTLVLSAESIPRRLAANPIGEKVSASLAIANDEIFIRGNKHLHCVGK